MTPPDASQDTPADVIAFRDALLRAQSSVQKAQGIRDASRAVELLAREGIRRRHPGIDEPEVHFRMAVLRLGADLAAAAYGPQHAAS